MSAKRNDYPANLEIDYPKQLNRWTTFFRIILVIPIFFIFVILTASGVSGEEFNEEAKAMSEGGGGILAGLFFATLLMILFRQKYPRWWFDFNLELNRFATRIGAYLAFVTDRYPSTDEAQAVHLDAAYPNAKKDLNRFLPLVKWLLAIPHYVVLAFLTIGLIFTIIVSWFAILFTGRYPKSLFNYYVGVTRWSWRVTAYAFLLSTDKYPPFSLDK